MRERAEIMAKWKRVRRAHHVVESYFVYFELDRGGGIGEIIIPHGHDIRVAIGDTLVEWLTKDDSERAKEKKVTLTWTQTELLDLSHSRLKATMSLLLIAVIEEKYCCSKAALSTVVRFRYTPNKRSRFSY